jgi:hypothetical protein
MHNAIIAIDRLLVSIGTILAVLHLGLFWIHLNFRLHPAEPANYRFF